MTYDRRSVKDVLCCRSYTYHASKGRMVGVVLQIAHVPRQQRICEGRTALQRIPHDGIEGLIMIWARFIFSTRAGIL